MGVMLPQAKELPEPPEAGRDKKDFPLDPQERALPC